MAVASGPNLGLVHGWENGASGWGSDVNADLRLLDALTQLAVLDRDLSAPPEEPADGARYLVASGEGGATGAWAGQEGRIACFSSGTWEFYAPRPGWRCLVLDEERAVRWTGSAWAGLEQDAGLLALLAGRAPKICTGYVGGGAMTPSGTSGAIPQALESASSGNTFSVMTFMGGRTMGAEFSFVLPGNWDGGSLRARVLWIPGEGAAAGELVRFVLAGASIVPGGSPDMIPWPPVYLDDAVATAGKLHQTGASAALTVSGTVEEGSLLHFRLYRDGDFDGGGAGTSMAVEAQVLGMRLQYGVGNAVLAWDEEGWA